MSKIIEINKLLNGITDLTRETSSINKRFVESKYCDSYFSEEISCFEDIFSQSVSLGFIINNTNNISLSKHGHDFVNLLTVKDEQTILDPNKKQIEFMRALFMNSKDFQNIYSKIFAKFRTNYFEDPPLWYALVRSFTRSEIRWIDILQELGMVEKIENIFQIDSKYSSVISALKNRISITLQELEYKLKHQKETGEQGEQLTLDYEIKRLDELDESRNLSARITQISKNDVFAGYDIISFNDQNSEEHDRFIEVKTTVNIFPSFFWSKNEVNKAQELGDKYWLYLWFNVNNSQKRTLLPIQDPYPIFFTGTIKPESVGYFVGENLLNLVRNKFVK